MHAYMRTYVKIRILVLPFFGSSEKSEPLSTRCSSHPQGKSEARCEKGGALIGVATALARPCGWVQKVERRCD